MWPALYYYWKTLFWSVPQQPHAVVVVLSPFYRKENSETSSKSSKITQAPELSCSGNMTSQSKLNTIIVLMCIKSLSSQTRDGELYWNSCPKTQNHFFNLWVFKAKVGFPDWEQGRHWVETESGTLMEACQAWQDKSQQSWSLGKAGEENGPRIWLGCRGFSARRVTSAPFSLRPTNRKSLPQSVVFTLAEPPTY